MGRPSADHDALLHVAGQVIAEHGIDAPLSHIAAAARVGPGTLYRHFPDRTALLSELALAAAGRFADVGAHAAAAPSAWEAIERYLDGAVRLHQDSPWLAPVLDWAREHPPAGWRPGSHDEVILHIVDQAHADGDLHPDVHATDLAFLPTMLAPLTRLPEPQRSAVLARQRTILLNGIATRRRPAIAPALDPADLHPFTRPTEGTAAE